jgi:serine/threonine-protein kinase
MVLEWLEGRSLGQDLDVRRQRGMKGRTLEETVKVLDSAAQALAYAHSQGVVHRDMNPGNLFLAETRQQGAITKVLDFGVAKVISDHALELGPRAHTLGQIRIFAPAYGSPEQFDDAVGKVSPATDVYSFAIISLEMMRDLPVRDGEHLGEFALMALDQNSRPTPRTLGIPVGDAVEEVFVRAVALKPVDRPSDMGEFWGSLKHAIREDAQSGKAPHADAPVHRPGWKPHAPAAGQAPPDRPVTADMPAPIVELARPGSVAEASRSHMQTVRMSSTPPAQPRSGSGAAALAATPLTSTLMMDNRPMTPPPPPAAKAPLNATLAMASPYAKSQDVPAYNRPSQPSQPVQPVSAVAATVLLEASPDLVQARARSEEAARAAVVSNPPAVSEVPTVVPPPPQKTSKAKLAVLIVVALLIVGLAAFAGFHSVASPSAPTSATDKATATAAPPATVSAAATATVSAPAPAPAVATATSVASAAAPAPAPASPSQTLPTTRSLADTPSPRGASRPTPVTFPTPTPEPASAPQPLASGPHAFDPLAAHASLDVINGVLASCRSPGGRTGDGTIHVTFSPDGRVQHASVDDPPYAGTGEGACVASRFKQAKVSPFEGGPGTVAYTFRIPPP